MNKESKVKFLSLCHQHIFLSPAFFAPTCHQHLFELLHYGDDFGYPKIHPSLSSNLKCNLGLFCDVSLHVDGKKFRAHRSILAANSDFFLNLFRAAEDQTNFVLAGVPVRGFSVLLDFCYTNSFTLEPSNVTEVYRAASVLNFSHISSACEKGKHIW